MAVARHFLAPGHREVMRLVVAALDKEADEAQAADARDRLGIAWDLCAYPRFMPTPIAVSATLES